MNYYNEIKKTLINNELNMRVKNYSINKGILNTYYKVGKILSDAGKHYGEGIIKEYSKKLTFELNVKYDISSLNKMRKFYYLIKKMVTVSPILSYSHYVELLPYEDINKIRYYINITEQQNLSVRELKNKIKSNEYERLPDETKNKLIKNEEKSVIDFIKNPILIKNNKTYEEITEKELQKVIMEDIPSFLKELGNGFTFIDNEYKIKLDDRYNYIDLLLYNIKYKCYVVIELKVTELKKEHTGQLMTYMNYIDKNIKTSEENDTVGIIICKYDKQSLTKRNYLLKQQICFVYRENFINIT